MKATEALRISHPGLAVEICEVPLTDPYGMLRKGDFDVQLQELPAREDDLGGGPALLVEERVLVIGSAHPLSARHSVSLEDLADVPLLTLVGELPDYWPEHHVPTCTPAGRPIAPAHTATYYARPGVAYVPFTDAEPVSYGLVWRTEQRTGPVEAFARTACDVAREMAHGDLRSTAPG